MAAMDIIKEMPIFLWPLFLIAGGLVVFGLLQAVKLTKEIGGIVKTVTTVAPTSNGEKAERTNVLSTLVEHIPKMSSSLQIIAEAMPRHEDYLKKIASVTIQDNNRSLKTQKLLEEAVGQQKRHYKKMDKRFGGKKNG